MTITLVLLKNSKLHRFGILFDLPRFYDSILIFERSPRDFKIRFDIRFGTTDFKIRFEIRFDILRF